MEANEVKVIAEIGCNHCGDLDIAKEMIVTAKSCGADYVKFQKRSLEAIPKRVADKPYSGEHSYGNTYYKHRAALEFTIEQYADLKNVADAVGIGFFATPFDVASGYQLYTLGVPYIKFGTTQMHDRTMWNWWRAMEGGPRPELMLSTGCCHKTDVLRAIWELQPSVLMHTTSVYPCDEADVDLLVIKEFAEEYGLHNCEYGLSGHYVSGNGAIEAAAVALGARFIERHFTLDRSWKGTDQAASLEPEGLKRVVKAIRTVERAMGDEVKKLHESEKQVLNKIKEMVAV